MQAAGRQRNYIGLLLEQGADGAECSMLLGRQPSGYPQVDACRV
jgi:hypothetical protein